MPSDPGKASFGDIVAGATLTWQFSRIQEFPGLGQKAQRKMRRFVFIIINKNPASSAANHAMDGLPAQPSSNIVDLARELI